MIALPKVKQQPSPNYTKTLITHDLFVAHYTEGSYGGAIAWLCNPQSKASAHGVLKADGSEITQLVPLKYKAWHAKNFNGRAIGLEIEGYTKNGFKGVTADAAARVAAFICNKYNIPIHWAKGGQGKGICQHHDLGQAGGGHHDCCGVGSPDWTAFMHSVERYTREMGFLLDDKPPKGSVITEPGEPPEPSHGSKPRNDDDDADGEADDTTSGYPDGSVADLQWRLNQEGARLVVDGHYGPNTKAAVAAYQKAHGLDVDGIAGKKTWASLRQ